MRRLGLVDSQGNLLSEEFDVEKAMKILEWRREIVDMLHQQLAIAEAERNQVLFVCLFVCLFCVSVV